MERWLPASGRGSGEAIRVGRKRVERLMAGQGWQGAFLRRGWRGGSFGPGAGKSPGRGPEWWSCQLPELVSQNCWFQPPL